MGKNFKKNVTSGGVYVQSSFLDGCEGETELRALPFSHLFTYFYALATFPCPNTKIRLLFDFFT